MPDEELAEGVDRISDPDRRGPGIWFHAVPDAKVVKNRLHFDIRAGGEWTDPIATRRKRIDAEASRLAWAPPSLARCPTKGTSMRSA